MKQQVRAKAGIAAIAMGVMCPSQALPTDGMSGAHVWQPEVLAAEGGPIVSPYRDQGVFLLSWGSGDGLGLYWRRVYVSEDTRLSADDVLIFEGAEGSDANGGEGASDYVPCIMKTTNEIACPAGRRDDTWVSASIEPVAAKVGIPGQFNLIYEVCVESNGLCLTKSKPVWFR